MLKQYSCSGFEGLCRKVFAEARKGNFYDFTCDYPPVIPEESSLTFPANKREGWGGGLSQAQPVTDMRPMKPPVMIAGIEYSFDGGSLFNGVRTSIRCSELLDIIAYMALTTDLQPEEINLEWMGDSGYCIVTEITLKRDITLNAGVRLGGM